MNDQTPQEFHDEDRAAGPIVRRLDPNRRRALARAIGGSGVLLAVHSRSALGQAVCLSPSATVSGNTSPQRGLPGPCTGSGGRSPGFWMQPQKFQYWASAGATHPEFDVVVLECQKGLGDLGLDNITAPGTLVLDVLPGAPVDPDTGIWAVLFDPVGFGSLGQLMRHLIAAWLNAGLFDGYPMTQSQITTDIWPQLLGKGEYCPPGMTCGDNALDREEFIAYIAGMFDINADLENDLCKGPKNP